jgi:2-dehydropantoate 2-reductase
MKVCVFGAGAIGGHLAARLAAGGAAVSIVARGEHLAAIQRNGLTVHTTEGVLHATVKASSDPGALGPQDAVLVTVKAPALPSVAHSVAPLLGAETGVVFVTNGIPWWYFHRHGGPHDDRRLPRIDPGDAVWNAIGPQRAIGGVVNAPSTVTAPGIIQVERANSTLTLGEPDGSLSPRAEAIAMLLRAGGIGSEVTPDIRTAIWDKLLGNLATGPMGVVTQSSYAAFLGEPACQDAARRVLDEAGAVAHALGCKVEINADVRISRVVRLAHKASILQDLELGRPMEIDGIFDAALELARLANVPTPTLDLLVGLAKVRARSARLYDNQPH